MKSQKTTRTLVIGDIHGGLKALFQILERAHIKTTDGLIFLGDYVDGWSDSPAVLDFLITLNTTHNCLFLRGNHDALLLQWLQNQDTNKLWLDHGGDKTVQSYLDIDTQTKNQHKSFLETLHNFYVDDQNQLFVHAGFTNKNGAQHEYFSEMLYWDRTLWETAIALDTRILTSNNHYPKRLKCYQNIFIGHTPVTQIGMQIPTKKANIWNLDTAAGFAGKLSIMDINSHQFWQSDPLPDLYPNEKGRNN